MAAMTMIKFGQTDYLLVIQDNNYQLINYTHR
jgi:hypothetical protein